GAFLQRAPSFRAPSRGRAPHRHNDRSLSQRRTDRDPSTEFAQRESYHAGRTYAQSPPTSFRVDPRAFSELGANDWSSYADAGATPARTPRPSRTRLSQLFGVTAIGETVWRPPLRSRLSESDCPWRVHAAQCRLHLGPWLRPDRVPDLARRFPAPPV